MKKKSKNTKKFKLKIKKNIIAILIIDVIIFLALQILKKSLLKTIILVVAFTGGWLVVAFIVALLMKKGVSSFKALLIIFFSFVIICFIGLFLFLGWVIMDAPEFTEKKLYQKEVSIIYDSEGNVMGKLGQEKREIISFEELPEVLVDAIIATEDSRFFQHNGFDLPRFFKATLNNIIGGSGGGASTITMQVSKNAFTSTEANGIAGLKRKFTDIYMSIFKIEKAYTKEEILEFYVNSYLMGGRVYGVEQACQTYFGKSAKDINLSEAATIAGLYQSPNKYNPIVNPENAKARRNTVLSLMVRHGYITEEEKAIAASIPIETLTANGNKLASTEYQDFIDTVVEDVKTKTGNDPYNIPMEIYTTMNASIQKAVNNVMTGKTYTWENDGVDAGIVVLDPNSGALVAIGAGRNRSVAGFNNATQTVRQIGSTAKPLYDYGPGIEYEGWSTYTPWADEPITYTGTSTVVNNFDGAYIGFTSSRYALAHSRNIPALKAFKSLNKKNVLNFVTGLGLSPETDGNTLHEAHAIGGYDGESPLTLANAYAAFANGGYYTEAYTFTKIVYRETSDTYEYKPKKSQAMKDTTAYMVYDMLTSAGKYILGSGYPTTTKLATKTGTSKYHVTLQNKLGIHGNLVKDLWLVGTDTNYTMAVWYGYDKLDEEYAKNHYYSVFGNTNHIKIFKTLIKSIWDKDGTPTMPSGVVSVSIEAGGITPYLASEYTPSDKILQELFIRGTEPSSTSGIYDNFASVENLTGSYSNGVVSLKWDAIDTPKAIDITYWEKTMKPLFETEKYFKEYLEIKKTNIKNTLGELTYDIYEEDSSGDLSLITSTTNTSCSFRITSTASSKKYIVKSTLSIYKNIGNKGSEITISFGNSSGIILSSLNGEEEIELSVGSSYVESGVRVFDNMIDVTNSATIGITYKNSSGTKVTSINTSSANTYTVTYNI